MRKGVKRRLLYNIIVYIMKHMQPNHYVFYNVVIWSIIYYEYIGR